MLQDDDIEIVKIFLAITKQEQLLRFEDRLNDPYKQWKLTSTDLNSRKKWNAYVKAVDEMFKETSPKFCRWNVISANHKPYARKEVLKTVTPEFNMCETWMEKHATKLGKRNLAEALKNLGSTGKDL